MARLRVLEAEAYIRTGDATSAARMTLLRLAAYHAPSVCLVLTSKCRLAYTAWCVMCGLLRLVCAVVGGALRAPGAAWRMALFAARAAVARLA
jgi:hypothetical protein